MTCPMSPNDLSEPLRDTSEGLNELLGARMQIDPQHRPRLGITRVGTAGLPDHPAVLFVFVVFIPRPKEHRMNACSARTIADQLNVVRLAISNTLTDDEIAPLHSSLCRNLTTKTRRHAGRVLPFTSSSLRSFVVCQSAIYAGGADRALGARAADGRAGDRAAAAVGQRAEAPDTWTCAASKQRARGDSAGVRGVTGAVGGREIRP